MTIRRWLLQGLIPLTCAGLALVGLAALGRLAVERLRGEDRYTVAFADLDCVPPDGLTREEFLDEVQYLAEQPDRLGLLDDGLAERLAAAFARHPWVEEVRGVEVGSRGASVRLVYRRAVLAVPLQDGVPLKDGVAEIAARSGSRREAKKSGRAVDKQGVLLPVKAMVPGLPVLYGDVAPPTGQAGSPWGDPRVEAAARTAEFLRLHQERLGLEEFEVIRGELVLSNSTVRVVWGHAPGAETASEARAAVKLERLLQHQGETGALSGPGGTFLEHDVRPADGAVRRPVPSPDKP
jgi:hypothetical protein